MHSVLGYSLRFRLRSATSFDGVLVTSFLGAALLVRVLTDDRSSPDSRHSGSLNLSGAIAVAMTIVASGLLLRRRRGMLPTAVAVLWLILWTAIAVNTRGASTETLREGVREASVVALAVIVLNGRESVTVPIAARLVQLVAVVPALLAIYQVATHSGMDVAGHIRSHGTFAHPNSAAVFFAIAASASLWLYLDDGRRRLDLILIVLMLAALIATFSIDGLATLMVMLVLFGALRSAPTFVRLAPAALAALAALAFFATPLGSQRIAGESSTNFATAETEEPDSTFAWRLHKWKTLLPEWERYPLLGRGLGTTTNVEGTSLNKFTGALPHNEYVRYLVETGALGLAALFGGLIVLGTRLVRRLRTSRTLPRGDVNVAPLALAIVVGCLVNALADNTFLNSPTSYAATLIVVSVLSLPSTSQRDRTSAL